MVSTLARMGKKKPTADRHKPRRMVGIPERICRAFEGLTEERQATLSELVKVACLKWLEEQGRWPPKDHPR